jgi:DNA polymerase-1
MKKAMIALNNHLKAEGHRARILLQVHDELVLEVPEDEVEIIRRVAVEELVKAGNVLDVPVVADARVGKNWDEMS